jgi:hypothetical protein
MTSLIAVLEQFNRKERNLAVRYILGHVKPPPALDTEFCHKACDELAFERNALDSAWWATDYHISWLAGALALHTKGRDAEKISWPNQPVKLRSRRSARDKEPVERQIAEGNQEDVDLLIATEDRIILIEIKAYSSWDPIQLQSKLTRIRLVKKFYEDELKGRSVSFHFVLLSPDRPKEETLHQVHWPDWVYRDSRIPWIKLTVPIGSDDIREVGRCNADGDRRAGYDRWGIFSLKGRKLSA